MDGAESLLAPKLPYKMKPRAAKAAADIQLQQFVRRATVLRDKGRVSVCSDTFDDRYDALRTLAGRIKQHTLDHLDVYLERFIDAAESAGTRVHFAKDAGQANEVCLAIARARGCSSCVKSKSMVTEETHLLPALEAAGVKTIETDLGEFIIQLDHDAPSHIVAPMIHKDRTAVARAFTRELGAEYTEDPQALTMIAREHLRRAYRESHLGITGANFLVADTGSMVVCTNEGNADFVMAGPRVHIAMVGIEKLVPSLTDLSVLLKLLARSATSQPLTIYTTMVTGSRRSTDHDGPDELHIILVDNGRTDILREETRELLRCIRCGACLNACPVYRKVGGGHAYGAVYSGPIGAVLTPAFKGLENYQDLPQASSLCGACYQACPVKIDIPSHLVRLRERMVNEGLVSPMGRVVMRAWARSLRSPRWYRLASRAQRVAVRQMGERAAVGSSEYADRGWVHAMPGPLSGWTVSRDFPTPTSKSFRDWWKARTFESGGRVP